jgi:hypothetical protein
LLANVLEERRKTDETTPTELGAVCVWDKGEV